jgi:DNA-binding MarR family transcriptional regulator
MTALAARTNATLPRLSHVVKRLEDKDLVARFPCPEDGRATNARLTDEGWNKLVQTAPGHVANVRRHVLDALSPRQVDELGTIAAAILERLDPEVVMTTPYRRPSVEAAGSTAPATA